jgi:HEAT repeat protein
MADDKALPWVREFLKDADKAVRLNGLRVLQYILYGPLNDQEMEAAKNLLEIAEMDPDAFVRERAQSIRKHDLPR